MLALRNVKNLSYAEIAQQLGIKIGTGRKSGIARAREHLLARGWPRHVPNSRRTRVPPMGLNPPTSQAALSWRWV